MLTENTPYQNGLIGLNSFGIGGANAFVVLKPYVPYVKEMQQLKIEHRLILFSARTQEGATQLLQKIDENQTNHQFISMIEHIFLTPITQNKYRGYIIVDGNNKKKPQHEITQKFKTNPQIWFAYGGMGSQWPQMARDMMNFEVFRKSMKQCAEALKPFDVDLEDVVLNGTEETFKDVRKCFPAIVAVEVCLTDLLSSIGVKPDKIIGHSLGETGYTLYSLDLDLFFIIFSMRLRRWNFDT